jgi:hypothetical protein
MTAEEILKGLDFAPSPAAVRCDQVGCGMPAANRCVRDCCKFPALLCSRHSLIVLATARAATAYEVPLTCGHCQVEGVPAPLLEPLVGVS